MLITINVLSINHTPDELTIGDGVLASGDGLKFNARVPAAANDASYHNLFERMAA